MTSVLVDYRISDAIERRLMALGFYPLRLPPSASLPEAIASHPDTLVCRIGDELITSADYCDEAAYIFTELRERHPSLKIRFTEDAFGKEYPKDCPFNALKLGKRLYARGESISAAVLDTAREHGYEHISVRQGYPACTTLAFESDAGELAITADCGMARVLSSCGVSVTKIENGAIALPPYEYGFIGGASGVYKSKIYFLGDLSTHPSADAIRAAALSVGFDTVSLSDEELFDGGGLIFID